MTEKAELASPDPLGIGGLLVDAYRLVQLNRAREMSNTNLLERLLAAAAAGLQYYAGSGQLNAPIEYRLAFRELGLAIGLHAVERMWRDGAIDTAVHSRLEALTHYLPLGDQIELFWRDRRHQRASTWSEHRDINEVMLATRLVPDGFLVLFDQPDSNSAENERKENDTE